MSRNIFASSIFNLNDQRLNIMKFCSDCGSQVKIEIPDGDNLPRHVCKSCDIIHYHNPKIVAGVIPEREGKILLCKRAIEPRYGLWTLPAGFMENSETTSEAAAREAMEEANAKINITSLYTMFSLPHISQVYVMYRGKLENTDYSPGIESLELKMCAEKDIPWGELAFPVVTETLRLYFKDYKRGLFPTYTGDIWKTSRESKDYTLNILSSE